ncbi:hemolysin family protein [Candidatus Acetothermia bacterium]|nr:hemolysin family protein [Candidatus Acetothermia bacterium]MCI2432114.1 hemolysin family protein [Candidatus Acetothermia bacterium]MCI2436734.1 hemolysin family protein [Candidatus Acetothermia bacterium]
MLPILEIFIIFLLILINGVFAMSEIAIVSARKARLQQRAEEGDLKARTALELTTNPNLFLSTVQIGITLVGILAGAFGGATIAEELEAYLDQIPALAPYSEAISIGLIVLSITYFSLILGELVPKRIALNNAERIAASVATPMRTLSVIVSPVVRILSASTNGVLRLLGIRPSAEPPVTEEEIKVLIEQGTQVGVFKEAEQDMIEGVLRLGERRVGTLMTPRTQIVWIGVDDSLDEIKQKICSGHHSRFPLVKENLDNVLGVVHTKDLLAQSLGGQPLDLKAISRPPLFVLERTSALQVLELFKQKGTHLALVIDEYGGVQGLITHNDILEDIVGQMPLIGAAAEPKAVRRDDGSLLIDGLLPIESLKEILKVKRLPDEETGNYYTVGGFVVTQMGKIPSAGEWFQWNGYHFEVLDMDWHRVDKILVKSLGK